MKFRIEYKLLSDCVSSVSRAVATRTANPALGNIHITVSEGKVRFVGSDQMIMMISTVPAEVESGGIFTVPAKFLQELISSLPSENDSSVLFEMTEESNGIMTISCERSRFEVPTQSAEEYPPIPVIEEISGSVVLNNEAFLKALKETNIAVCTDMQITNPAQNGICFDWENGNPTMVSTDSKRLAITKVAGLELPEELKKNFIIPARAISEIMKLCETNDEVKLGVYGSQLLFSNSKDQFITRLIEANFPKYEKIVPKTPESEEEKAVFKTWKITKKALLQAFKVVTPIARQINGQVLFDISAIETKIWADARDNGRAEHIVSSSLEGDPINISFNIKFITDFLNVIDDEEVYVEMTRPGWPGVMKVGNPESEFKYLVMPMNRPPERENDKD